MEELLKSVFKSLDIPEALQTELIKGDKKIEDFNTHFQDTFIAKKLATSDKNIRSTIGGEITGSITTAANRAFGFTKGETEGLKVEEIVAKGVESFNTKIKELEESKENTNDEQVEKLTKDFDKLKEKFNTSESALLDSNKTIESNKLNYEKEIKGNQVSLLLNTEKAKLAYIDDITPLQKAGFESILSSKYKFDLEDDKFGVTDLDGNKIQNENKTEFLNPLEVLKLEATENKLLKMNNTDTSNTNTTKNNSASFQTKIDQNGKPERILRSAGQADALREASK